jgi:hypothetical protein
MLPIKARGREAELPFLVTTNEYDIFKRFGGLYREIVLYRGITCGR